jgi:tetratricopeptide (TPR) repeat protein
MAAYRMKVLWNAVSAGKGKPFFPQQLLAMKARVLVVVGEWDRAEAIYRENLDMARLLGDQMQEAGACIDLGDLVELRSRYPEAMELAQKAEAIYKESGDLPGMEKACRLMSKVHLGWSDFPKALEMLARALDLSKQAGNDKRCAEILGNMALAHYWMGNTEKAIFFAEEERRMVEARNNPVALANAYHTIGRIHRENHYYEKAQPYLEKAMALYQVSGDMRSIAMSLGSLGGMQYYKGLFSEALELFHRQIDIAGKLGERYFQACAYGDMSSVYLEMGDYDRARRYAMLEMEAGLAIGDRICVSDAHFHLGLIGMETGDYQEAGNQMDRAVEQGRQIESGRFLPDYLAAKAGLLYKMGMMPEAEEANRAAMAEAARFERPDLLNAGRWQQALLEQARDPSATEDYLSSLEADPESSDDTKAEAFFLLWKRTGRRDFRDKALEAYRRLMAKRPKPLYLRQLGALEG